MSAASSTPDFPHASLYLPDAQSAPIPWCGRGEWWQIGAQYAVTISINPPSFHEFATRRRVDMQYHFAMHVFCCHSIPNKFLDLIRCFAIEQADMPGMPAMLGEFDASGHINHGEYEDPMTIDAARGAFMRLAKSISADTPTLMGTARDLCKAYDINYPFRPVDLVAVLRRPEMTDRKAEPDSGSKIETPATVKAPATVKVPAAVDLVAAGAVRRSLWQRLFGLPTTTAQPRPSKPRKRF